MREMIYRIWDEKVKRYVQDHDDFFIDPDGELHTIDIYEGADRFCSPGRYIIEQYTGLKDKNGKRIFDGDIHEYDGLHFSVKFGYYTDDDTHVEMYGWYLDSNSLEEQGSLGVDSEKYVNIIGNIHEGVQV